MQKKIVSFFIAMLLYVLTHPNARADEQIILSKQAIRSMEIMLTRATLPPLRQDRLSEAELKPLRTCIRKYFVNSRRLATCVAAATSKWVVAKGRDVSWDTLKYYFVAVGLEALWDRVKEVIAPLLPDIKNQSSARSPPSEKIVV